MHRFSIKSRIHEGEPCIDIKGYLSNDNGLDSLLQAFQKSLEKVKENLYVRMADLTFIDSTCLGVIMFNFNKLSKQNRKLVILDPSEEIRNLMEYTSLDKVFHIQ